MIRYVVLVVITLVFGAFGATQAQEDVSQTDPTNCAGSWMFIQNDEVWEIPQPGWEPILLWGGETEQVECIGIHLLALRPTDVGYVIDAPTTVETDVLSQFEYIDGTVTPDGLLFQVSQNVLWFSGQSQQVKGVFGLYYQDNQWFLISPFSNWGITEEILGITVSDSLIPEAVETAEGVYFLVGFDKFVAGAFALNGLTVICPPNVDQPGCIPPWQFYGLGVPQAATVVNFASFGTRGRDYLLELQHPDGTHEIWAFDNDTQVFAPVSAQ